MWGDKHTNDTPNTRRHTWPGVSSLGCWETEAEDKEGHTQPACKMNEADLRRQVSENLLAHKRALASQRRDGCAKAEGWHRAWGAQGLQMSVAIQRAEVPFLGKENTQETASTGF